jgi:heptosyltransferase-1
MVKIPADPKSILIVKLSSIGDVIHALPVATALRRRFPGARITWLVSRKAREIVSGHPHLDQILVVNGSGENGEISVPGIEHPFLAARVLRKIGFDVALDLQGLIRSSFFTLLSGAPTRIGFRTLREAAFLFYNVRTIPPAREQHIVDGYMRFAAQMGAPIDPVEFHISTAPADEAAIDRLLSEAGVNPQDRLVAIAPASSWKAKTWPPARLGPVADYLTEHHGCKPVIVGARGDLLRAQEIQMNCRAPIINFAGKTSLKELTVLLRRCTTLVGNDSGPTHLAAAVGKPVVAIYGPTSTELLSPYGKQHITLTVPLPCRPCHRRSRAENCPHLRCINDITSDQVCNAVDRLFANLAERSHDSAVG